MERKSGVIDLPANVTFQRNDDDWELDQSVDVIMSVQAFLNDLSSAGRIDRLSKTRFFLLTLGAAFIGFVFGIRFIDTIGVLAPVIGAFAGGAVPRMYRAKFRDIRIGQLRRGVVRPRRRQPADHLGGECRVGIFHCRQG